MDIKQIIKNINQTGNIISAIIDGSGNFINRYSYNAYGNVIYSLNQDSDSRIIFKGYYYDKEIGLYWIGSRCYNPKWGRFIQPSDVSTLNPSNINGLNLYAYCRNNPVMNKERFVIDMISFTPLYLSGNNTDSSTIISPIKHSSLKSSNFNLFGYESRLSNGWNNSPDIATEWFGRVGFSSYVTKIEGQSGMFYAFVGSTSDSLNLFGTTYYAGIGINLFDIIGLEVQLETIGISAEIKIGNIFINVDINLIGGTSITLGHNTDLGNGRIETEGFTIGINTGSLVLLVVWIYKAVTTGDFSPVPTYLPV